MPASSSEARLDPFDCALLDADAPTAARRLLGALLVRDDGDGRRRIGRIVETEAYGGRDDLASHARFGPTARNAVMGGPPGIAYVYLVYGMYDCLNVVTGEPGAPAAVLIRAVEPLEGVEHMRTDRLTVEQRRRATRTDAGLELARARLARTPDRALARGPGLVGAAFGIDRGWTGTDLCAAGSPLRLAVDADWPVADRSVLRGPRVGVGYAGDHWASRPWRYRIDGHTSVSRAR